MPSILIDISAWQTSVNHAKVAASGVVGCLIKASTGTSGSPGGYFATQAPVAKRTYPLYGGYHWLSHGVSPAAQVATFIAQLKAGFGKIDGIVCYLDAEDVDTQNRPLLTVAEVKAFKHAWDAATGSYPLLFYGPQWYWEQVSGYTQLAGMGFAGWFPSNYVTGANGARTLATAVTDAQWAGWAGLKPVILQYSGTGTIPGITGAVDLDQIRLSVAAFKALATREDGFLMALSDTDQANVAYTLGVSTAAKHAGVEPVHVRLASVESELKAVQTQLTAVQNALTALSHAVAGLTPQ